MSTLFPKTRLIALLISVFLLNACSWMDPFHWFTSKECVDKSSDYLTVEDHAPLAIPPGSDTPDRRNLFVIPEGKRNDVKGKCLDKPPSYFGNAARVAASPEETIADWAQAWADRNVDSVISMYSSQYGSLGAVTSLEQRRTEIATGALPDGRVRGLKVSSLDNDRRLAKFNQTFGGTQVSKEITLIRESGMWKIIDEKVITAK
ncbi:MAG TPA: hypothetical protein VHL14_03910 [Steroidobacteraceae bacterium]|jgi:hypothetical protein|nr:hypothetical protein [Steroidobacteraceae bacterium]